LIIFFPVTANDIAHVNPVVKPEELGGDRGVEERPREEERQEEVLICCSVDYFFPRDRERHRPREPRGKARGGSRLEGRPRERRQEEEVLIFFLS
jgi:hypothetical protein